MSAKGKKQGSTRLNGKGEQRTTDRQKENTRKYRSIPRQGEPFDDVTQPTRREIWVGRLKKAGKWAGSTVVTVVVTGMLKKYLTPDAIMRLLRKLFTAE